MAEELNNSANNDARPVDPLDAAIETAFDSLEEKEEVKTEEKSDDKLVEAEVTENAEEDKIADEVEEEEQAELPESVDKKDSSAPEHWPAEDKALLDKIKDEEARNLVMQIDKRLQAAHTRRSQELSDHVKVSETIKKTFEPYQNELRREGLNEVTAIDALIREYQNTKEFVQNLQSNPKEVIAGLAKQYGVSLDGLNDEDGFKDPYVAQLEHKIAQLEGKVGEVTNGFQQKELQSYIQQVENFANDKNSDGSLKHPHFLRVQEAMKTFISSGDSLGTAYDKAVRIDPELYQERLNKELQDKIRENMRKADIEKAKKAKRNLNGHGSASVASKKINSLDDALNAAFEQLSR